MILGSRRALRRSKRAYAGAPLAVVVFTWLATLLAHPPTLGEFESEADVGEVQHQGSAH